MNLPKPVFLESPFAGDLVRNINYARECMLDSIVKGEAPFVSHLLYPQVLNDENLGQRQMGLLRAATFRSLCVLCVVYDDLGISPGMKLGMDHARDLGIDIVFRRLYHA